MKCRRLELNKPYHTSETSNLNSWKWRILEPMQKSVIILSRENERISVCWIRHCPIPTHNYHRIRH